MPTTLTLFPPRSPVSTKPTLLHEWQIDQNRIQLYLQDDKIVGKKTNFLNNQKSNIEEIEGIPKEIIDNADKLTLFLADTYTSVSPLSDGSEKLYIKHRLKGGGNTLDVLEDQANFWPNGVIPYQINYKDFPKGSEKHQQILAAIATWQNAKTGFTFVERTTEQDYVYFQNFDSKTCKKKQSNAQSKHRHSSKSEALECESKCDSYVGRQGGQQDISCDLISNDFNTASIIHEIGHAIGLYHEHQREDRDEYVIVNSSDENNYGIEGKKFGKYDFYSIMHYSLDDEIQLKTENPILENIVGKAETLSQGDIAAAKYIYQQTMDYQQKQNQHQQQPIPANSQVSVKNRTRLPLFRQTINLKAIYDKANQLQDEGHFQDAHSKYLHLITNYSNHAFIRRLLPNIYNNIGACVGNLNKHELALEYFQKSLNINNNLQARLCEGIAFKNLRAYPEALKSLQMIPPDMVIRPNSLHYQANRLIEEIKVIISRLEHHRDEESAGFLAKLCLG